MFKKLPNLAPNSRNSFFTAIAYANYLAFDLPSASGRRRQGGEAGAVKERSPRIIPSSYIKERRRESKTEGIYCIVYSTLPYRIRNFFTPFYLFCQNGRWKIWSAWNTRTWYVCGCTSARCGLRLPPVEIKLSKTAAPAVSADATERTLDLIVDDGARGDNERGGEDFYIVFSTR